MANGLLSNRGVFVWLVTVGILALAAAACTTLLLTAQARGLLGDGGSWFWWRLVLAGLLLLGILLAAQIVTDLTVGRLVRPARSTGTGQPTRRLSSYAWALGVVLFLLGLGAAVSVDGLRLTTALALGVTGSLTLVFAAQFLSAVERGEPALFESHWGGLGGGLGGWRISSALAYLLAACLFGTLAAGLAFQARSTASPEKPDEKEAGQGGRQPENAPKAQGIDGSGEEPGQEGSEKPPPAPGAEPTTGEPRSMEDAAAGGSAGFPESESEEARAGSANDAGI